MSFITKIQIADLTLIVNHHNSASFRKFPPVYKTFIKEAPADDQPADIYINVSSEDVSFEKKNLQKVFDTNESWSMYLNEDNEYLFALNPPSPSGEPVWLARSKRDFQNITVFLNNPYRDTKGDNLQLFNPFGYPLDQILLMYFLAQREGALIHAAGLCFNDRGYIFPGKSGAGKSTISRQLAGLDYYEFLSDDRIIVRKIDKTFRAFGTPWPGEAGIALNKNVALSGIFFISQASFNKIEEIKPQKALERLLPVVSITWYDKEVMVKILDFCEDLISNVPLYELHFKPGNEIIDVFQNFVSK